MSLKPQKKTDLGKSWMKPRRDRKVKISPEYHLIITEGTKTEPLYFQAIRDIINQKYQDRIQLDISGEGDNTLSLFERAKERVAKSVNGYSHVWVVYDTDDFPADHINRTAELCGSETTEETAYHAIWSNQCVELWYLLHFGFFQSDIDRKAYGQKLTQHLKLVDAGSYAKNRPDMFDVLRPYMDSAIKNAKLLDRMNEGKTPADSVPGTKVFELIEVLNSYLED